VVCCIGLLPLVADARPVPTAIGVSLPTPNVQWDYQIGGAFTPARWVGVVSRDRNAAPSPGDYNICYVNAYQTQPDERDFWMDDPDHWRLVLTDENGDPVVDGQWGEFLLDTGRAASGRRWPTSWGSGSTAAPPTGSTRWSSTTSTPGIVVGA